MRFKNMLEYYNSKCGKQAHHIKTENSMRISVVDMCQKSKVSFTVELKNGSQNCFIIHILFHWILKYK